MKTIEILPMDTEISKKEVKRLYEIMIHAYAVTEAEIWGENYLRLPFDEFETIARSGEMIGAWVDGIPVGSIHVKRLTGNDFSFGLLSVDFNYKGMHLGRSLIDAAEKKARKEGGTHMILEILRPEEQKLEFKERLSDWYIELGYQFTETVPFQVVEPTRLEKMQQLAQPSVFDCYRKKLIDC